MRRPVAVLAGFLLTLNTPTIIAHGNLAAKSLFE